MCQTLFSNKVARLRPACLLKKKLWHRCFAVKFVKFSRTPISPLRVMGQSWPQGSQITAKKCLLWIVRHK